jgi:hypothetical protein
MCAGGDLMEKTFMKATQLLQKISKAAAMRRDWETRIAAKLEHNSRMKTCAEISKEATLEDKKGIQSQKNLKKCTSSQELPQALTSPSQMKQKK